MPATQVPCGDGWQDAMLIVASESGTGSRKVLLPVELVAQTSNSNDPGGPAGSSKKPSENGVTSSPRPPADPLTSSTAAFDAAVKEKVKKKIRARNLVEFTGYILILLVIRNNSILKTKFKEQLCNNIVVITDDYDAFMRCNVKSQYR